MSRTRLAVAALALALALATVPAGTFAQPTGESDAAPGARLAGVVGVQGTEVRAAVDERRFAARLNRSASNESKADAVADRVNETRDRLAALERERDRLEAAYENGSISRGEYRARTARLVAETRTLKRSLNHTANVSQGLPADRLQANGVNATAIDRLRTRAANLSGPETAAIARSIAGNDAGGPPDGVPGRGPPGNESGEGSPGRSGEASGNASGDGPPGQSGEASDDSSPGRSGETRGNASGDGPPGQPGESGNETGTANRSDESSTSDSAPARGEDSSPDGDDRASDARGDDSTGEAANGNSPDERAAGDAAAGGTDDGSADGGADDGTDGSPPADA